MSQPNPDGFLRTHDVFPPGADPTETRGRIARGELISVCRGIWAPAVPEDPIARHLQLVRGCLFRSRQPLVVAGVSAALLHGLPPAPGAIPRLAEFVLPGKSRGGTDYIARSTRLPRHHVVEIDGVRVTSLARTLVDVNRQPTWDAVLPTGLVGLVVLEAALYRCDDVEALRADYLGVVDDLQGCAGMAAAKQALTLATSHAAGPAETISRLVMTAHGLPVPLLDVGYPDGTTGSGSLGRTVRLPFCWPRPGMLGVVLDRPDGVPIGLDLRRREWEALAGRIRRSGWYLVEWTADELTWPWDFCRRLDTVLSEGLEAPEGLPWQALPRDEEPSSEEDWECWEQDRRRGRDRPTWVPEDPSGPPYLPYGSVDPTEDEGAPWRRDVG